MLLLRLSSDVNQTSCTRTLATMLEYSLFLFLTSGHILIILLHFEIIEVNGKILKCAVSWKQLIVEQKKIVERNIWDSQFYELACVGCLSWLILSVHFGIIWGTLQTTFFFGSAYMYPVLDHICIAFPLRTFPYLYRIQAEESYG